MIQMTPVAVLSSDLLARKGTAVPTSRASWSMPSHQSDRDIKSLLAAVSEFERTDDDLDHPKPADEPATAPRSGKPIVKLSLRIDRERHSKLRLVAFHLARSGQDILVEALDQYLGRAAQTVHGGQCTCLLSNPG